MYVDGYKYWLAYKKNDKSYFRCCRYKNPCAGRCVMENGKIRNATEHSHEPEPDKALIDAFRKILTQRASSEKTDLYKIYWEEAAQRHSDAAMLYSFHQAESAMRKARRKQLPKAPNTIRELGDILSVSELFRINSGLNKHQFYKATISLEDTTCVIFMHKNTLETLGCVEELHIDASFDSIPKKPPNYHLMTIHSVQGNTSTPIIYTIMTGKTKNGYAQVFAYIREHLSAHIKPNVILCDYDHDMQTALVYTFPEANIKGNWFHYTDAVLKQVKLIGIQRETSKNHGASSLRMLLVLPLLPADYMAPGLEALKKWMQEKGTFSSGLSNLCNYIEQNWLRAVGAEKMSIFGLSHCFINYIKAFNKDLRNMIGISNPMIWHMLETLTHMATKTYVKLCKKSKGLIGTKQLKKCQLAMESIVTNATQLWIRTPVHLRNPLQFLQLCSHCISNPMLFVAWEEIKNNTQKLKADIPRNYNLITTTTPSTSSTMVPQLHFNLTKTMNAYQQPQHQVQTCTLNTQIIPSTITTDIGQQFTIFDFNSSTNQVQLENPQETNQLHLLQQPQHSDQQQTQIIRVTQTDPPPLAFFPQCRQRITMPSEPPPLVPFKQIPNKRRKVI